MQDPSPEWPEQSEPAARRAGQTHDSLFKYVFGMPEHAASQLRAVLPTALADRLDLADLQPVNGSFVDDELTHRHCDILLRTRLDGHDAYVYALIEHQSSPDRMMPLRMLRYLLRIWDRHLELHPNTTHLPMIVPLVMYQGTGSWNHPTELSELLDVDPETTRLAGDFLPRFRFVLDDLTRLDAPTLRARPLTTPARLTVRLLRIVPTAHTGDAVAALDPEDIADFRGVLRYPNWWGLLAAFLTYIESGTETPPHRLAALAAQIGPGAEEAYMSTADMLRAEGRAEGAARLLLRLLTRRFGTASAEVRTRIDTATLEQLDTWSDRVLDAPTVDDVFR